MKKALPKAIALATSLGLAAAANAVNVNSDGTGQVLLYPVYTAESGNFTAIAVTNTTDQYKAVKVRFLEGMNSKEVLDFNLYLSPYDVWTANVVKTPNGAKITTVDESCTAGDIAKGFDGVEGANAAIGQQFFNYEYQSDGPAAPAEDVNGYRSEARTRVGHIEIIEMSDLDPAAALGTTTVGQAIKHVAGVPGNCAAVRAAWNAGGAQLLAADTGVSGGLYGTGAIINVEAGTEYGYDAVALENFWSVDGTLFPTPPAATVRHTDPGNLLPSLTQAAPIAVFANGVVAEVDSGNGIDAVSAVLMKDSIKNDYAVGAGLNAETDWVVTFPTKTHYVNPSASAPFSTAWAPVTASACEQIALSYWDREEGSAVVTNAQFSPRPPAGPAQALCYETNIVRINGTSNILSDAYTDYTVTLNSGFETGWLRLSFVPSGSAPVDAARVITGENAGGDTVAVTGLPVIGFAAIAIQNGDVGGLLSNYGTSNAHKATSTVTVTP